MTPVRLPHCRGRCCDVGAESQYAETARISAVGLRMVRIAARIAVHLRWRALRDDGHVARHPSSAYAPKAPAQGVLYQVVRDHFETFRVESAARL